MLTQQGIPSEEIEQEFGSPRPVKGFTTSRRESPRLAPLEPMVPFVTASFAVTKSGKTRNIEVIDKSDSATTRMIRNARARLRGTVFRPKISAEGPVESQSTIRYLYPDGTI